MAAIVYNVRRMKKLVTAIKWIGEWLFVIFVLVPLLLLSLALWKKDMYEDN
jgi:hypothetical protein